MAILGESFKQYVRDQINIRQDKLSLQNKDDNILKYITSKTSFLRLSSGVDIDAEVAKNLGFSPYANYSSNRLAQEYVLFSSQFNNNFTSNIGYNSLYPNASYGFTSDSNYGFTPPPGLLSATVNTLNRGTIREATINLVCHNIYQFKIINVLFLKLKYSLLLEWGHNLYFNNGTETNPNPSLISPVEVPNLSPDFINGSISSDEILKRIEIKRKESCGNYDAFFGLVKNFNWELQENGSYNVTINAISQGDVIESIKVNSNLAPNEDADSKGIDSKYQKSTLHYILGWIIKKLDSSGELNGYKETDTSDALNTETLASITNLQFNYKDPLDTGAVRTGNEILTDREGIKIQFPNLQTDKDGAALPQYYIKFGTLLRIVESFLLYYDTQKEFEDGSHPSIFYIDHRFADRENECITTPNHLSVDPLTCLIPIDFNAPSSTTDVVYLYNLIENTYEVTISGTGVATGITTTVSSTTQALSDPPEGLEENKEIVTSANASSGQDLFLIQNNVTDITTAQNLINQYANTLSGQTVTLTTKKFTKTTQAAVTNITQAGTVQKLDDSFRQEDTPNIGKTMHIYVNINKIIEVLDNNIDNNGDVGVYNFITQLLNQISRALCSINKFDLEYDEENNRFYIVDTAVMPLKYQNIEKSKTAKFNINLLKSSANGGGSFVTNFGLKSDVFGQISNAIAVGAQAGGNKLFSNSSYISNFNTGLTDRIITVKNNKTSAEPDPNRGFDQYTAAYTKYNQFKIKLTNTQPGTGLTPSDVSLFESYLVDLMQYDLGVYTTTNNIPGTGFIPLNLHLTMDGLSGIKQYQTFDIDETLLPIEYYDRLKFITTTVTHKIDTKGWETTINSLGVPKTKGDVATVPKSEPIKIERNQLTEQDLTDAESSSNNSGISDENSDLRKAIVRIAKAYYATQENSEIYNDLGFEDKTFQSEITEVGWKKGYAWCNLFAELVYKKAYTEVGAKDPSIAAIAKDIYNDFNSSKNAFSSNVNGTAKQHFIKGNVIKYDPSTTILRPGDLLLYSWKDSDNGPWNNSLENADGLDHIGIFIEKTDAGKLVTIGGNEGSGPPGVKRREKSSTDSSIKVVIQPLGGENEGLSSSSSTTTTNTSTTTTPTANLSVTETVTNRNIAQQKGYPPMLNDATLTKLKNAGWPDFLSPQYQSVLIN